MDAISALYRRQPVYTVLGLFLLLSIPVLGVLEVLDERTVDNVGVWVKPLKFSVSLGTYLLTLAFFVPWMREGANRSTSFGFVVTIVSLAIVYETIWLWTASGLGIRSHFNYDSVLFSLLYAGAGLMAAVLVIGALAQGISTLRGARKRSDFALSVAIGWGLVLTFFLTSITAYPLSSAAGELGGSPNGYGKGYFGWRVEGGDLRAAHFFAIHALHFIPFAGFVVSRVLPGSAGAWLMRLFAAVYSAFTLYLAWLVHQGQDLPAYLISPF